tara:strand:- start:1303 stop:1830 length:528 start_codon:yes stop_codon:yes gene_type:complete
MIKLKLNKGDIREDGKRYDGYTWREVGVNHHMNNKGLIYYKRKYRTIDGYLQQGGNMKKIKYNATDVSDIGKVVTLLYDQQTTGFLYAVTNSAWKEWVKIGMAVNAEDRLKGYQTSSPFRDYELNIGMPVKDRRLAEAEAHKQAEEIATERKGEWFRMPLSSATKVVKEVSQELA